MSQQNETQDPKPFLSSALENFPDITDILVLADALDDNGEHALSNAMHYLIKNRQGEFDEKGRRKKLDPEISNKITWVLAKAREELTKKGIYLHNNSIRTQDGTEYEWHGNTVAQRPPYGAHRSKIIDIKEIDDTNILKGLSVLAAIFFANAFNNPYGLQDYTTTKKNLSKEGNKQRSIEQELRYSLRSFLMYFNQFESLVKRINNTTRPRFDDLAHAEKLINYRNYGYLWEIPLTTQIVQQYVKTYGTTPFLTRLSVRIIRAINLIPHRINEDEKMVNDLRTLANVMRG